MSSILKALKKVEHEKTGHFAGSLNINSDILKTTDTSTRRFSPFSLVLLLLLVFGGGAAVAFFFLQESETKPKVAPQPVIAEKSIPTPVPAPVVNYDALPPEIVVVPARGEQSGEAAPKQRKAAAAGNAAKRTAGNPAGEAVSGISEKPKEAIEAVKSALPPAAAVPALRVNGIAFQISGAENMAIVNGTAVSTGSKIEGAIVVDIRKDRVLFQHDREKFEILLGQSNR